MKMRNKKSKVLVYSKAKGVDDKSIKVVVAQPRRGEDTTDSNPVGTFGSSTPAKRNNPEKGISPQEAFALLSLGHHLLDGFYATLPESTRFLMENEEMLYQIEAARKGEVLV
jgi:hypothetical protein